MLANFHRNLDKEVGGWINIMTFLLQKKVFTGYEAAQTQNSARCQFLFKLNLDRQQKVSSGSSGLMLNLIRRLLYMLMDAKDKILQTRKAVPKDRRIRFLMLALLKSYFKSIERGLYRSMHYRLKTFLLPYLTTRYVSIYL